MKNKKIIIVIIGITIILILCCIIIFLNSKNIKVVNPILNKLESNITIKESETKKINLVDYEDDAFTMKIPDGWEVKTAGTEMFYAINIKDPQDERNQIFSVLKASPLLKSYDSKQWHTWYVNITGNQAYKLLSDAIVLNPATTENFYSNFNNYTDYIKTYEPTYNGFDFPFLSMFTKIEEYESNTYMKNLSLDDKTIRASYEDSSGKKAEGLFMASIVSPGTVYAGSVDTSFYDVYNVIFITSAKDEFINYESKLTEAISTLKYKDSFVNSTNATITERTNATLKANATIQSAFDSYNSAWSKRQKTYDIESQKYSDATLGYERVYDTETGDIYKAYNGFTDDYTGSKYKTITDDNMYAESISGYIEKK